LLLALLIAAPLAGPLDVTPEMGLTLLLLTIGIGISNLAGTISALFSARERMEVPAYISVVTTVLKVAFGVVVLALGYGIVGLALTSIAVNLVTAAIFIVLLRPAFGPLRPVFSPGLGMQLLGLSYALMLNNLLATVFFRIDGLLLRAMAGDLALGWYQAAYKFIDGLNVVPSTFTLALFPLLARLAPRPSINPTDAERSPGGASASTQLVYTTERALKLLLTLALPLMVGTAILAEPIVRVVAGEAYLPYAALALQVLICFVPFSFVNGLLQYVLISVHQQRFLTLAFVIAVVFNITVNVILIPRWSYLGAAVATVLSEVVLLVPFWLAVRRHVGPVRLGAFAWRPTIAATIMGAAVWGLRDVPLAAICGGIVLYGLVILGIGGIDREERAAIRAAAQLRSRRGGPRSRG
jgi:O-antigen/teichoic acid export membrane protein